LHQIDPRDSLSRDANSWTLDPFSEIRNDDHTLVERGKGNANSVEFNLLYRWHATLSEPDVAWLERMFAASFAGKKADQVTIEDFKGVRLILLSIAYTNHTDLRSPTS
jgi:linoleate 10R-lipoxygenase